MQFELQITNDPVVSQHELALNILMESKINTLLKLKLIEVLPQCEVVLIYHINFSPTRCNIHIVDLNIELGCRVV